MPLGVYLLGIYEIRCTFSTGRVGKSLQWRVSQPPNRLNANRPPLDTAEHFLFVIDKRLLRHE